MERKDVRFTTGNRGPVFGATSIRASRPGMDLPVNLVATAMAAEKTNGGPSDSNPSGGHDARHVESTHSAEVAELIGQEELPLRGAMAAARSKPLDYGNRRSLAEARSRGDGCDEGDGDRRENESIAPQTKVAGAGRVTIETCVIPGRGGRPSQPEHYPFGALLPVTIDEHGNLSGPCFFIPDADDPARLIAAARKRHRPKVFLTRQAKGGRMIWREK